MQVNTNVNAYANPNAKENPQISQYKNTKSSEQTASKISAKEISNSYFLQFQAQSLSVSSSNFSTQSAVGSLFGDRGQNFPQNLAEILKGIDYDAIGYSGKSIDSLSPKEAGELVGEDGFFGIKNTADRIANFVISAAGDDAQKLQAGREGILKGFKDAAKLWGGDLPEISQRTIDRALESVDKRIAELGGNVLNVSA